MRIDHVNLQRDHLSVFQRARPNLYVGGVGRSNVAASCPDSPLRKFLAMYSERERSPRSHMEPST